MFIFKTPFITKLYATDEKIDTGDVVVAEEDKKDPPQEEPDKKELADDNKDDKNDEKKKEEPSEDELEIEGLTEREDGRLEYKVGNSVYISKEGLKGNKAVSDVLRQERESVSKRDEQFEQLRKKTSKEKAALAIKTPKDEDEDSDKPPELKSEREIINAALTKRGLVAGMDKWTDEHWLRHQEEKELKDWQVSRLQREVENAMEDANQTATVLLRQYNNAIALKDAQESVRDMLSDVDGVDPDEYAEEYMSIVRRARTEGLNQHKEISANWIIKEMGKVVAKTLNSRQKSQLQTQIEKEIAENKKRRRENKPPVHTGGKFQKDEKKPMSIAEATRMIMEEERKRKVT